MTSLAVRTELTKIETSSFRLLHKIAHFFLRENISFLKEF
jgi:hypothetical protein